MNTSGVSNFMYRFSSGLNLRQRLFELIPNMTVKNSKKCSNLGAILSRPDVNRGLMGATALMTQPFIDYYNPRVDKETASASTCRTCAKIIAGTTVGMGVRNLCYNAIKAFTTEKQNVPEWRRWLMPSNTTIQKLRKLNVDWLKNYKNTLATTLGLGAMLITNVALDVPLTNLLSKTFLKWRNGKNGNAQNTATQQTPIQNNQIIQQKMNINSTERTAKS